uniref:Uncharacterized protein n=1 Tax=Ditylenchus dipsaci TaxID=166011 RepID=A0A915D6Y6_9BILA
MDFDDELWNSIEGVAQAHTSPTESKMYSGFGGKNLHHQQQHMQHYSGGKQQFMSGKMQVEEDQYSEVSETISPFNQFDNYDKDFFGYSNVFGYGNQADEGFDEGHSHVEACRATYQAHYQNLVHHESIVPPVIKQIVDGAKAQVSTLLSAAEDDIMSLDIDECVKQRIQQVFELCKSVAKPNEANQKTLESRILSFNASI